MNIKELRVGNYIFSDTHRVTLIDGFLQDSVYENIKDERVKYILSQIAYCKPIPLTEEWLLKFGFEKKLHGYWNEKLFIRICENGGFFFDWNGTIQSEGTEINYVHQLQNLYFALTGEELQLK